MGGITPHLVVLRGSGWWDHPSPFPDGTHDVPTRVHSLLSGQSLEQDMRPFENVSSFPVPSVFDLDLPLTRRATPGVAFEVFLNNELQRSTLAANRNYPAVQ